MGGVFLSASHGSTLLWCGPCRGTLNVIGWIILVFGLIAFGAALSRPPLGASAGFTIGYFAPSGLIVGLGAVLLLIARRLPKARDK